MNGRTEDEIVAETAGPDGLVTDLDFIPGVTSLWVKPTTPCLMCRSVHTCAALRHSSYDLDLWLDWAWMYVMGRSEHVRTRGSRADTKSPYAAAGFPTRSSHPAME